MDSIGKTHADTSNQTLANILEIQKIAENRYFGIPTIRAEMAGYNLPEPIFESRRGNFIVTFKNNQITQIETDNGQTLLEFCREPRTRDDIAAFLKMTQYYVMKTHFSPLVEFGKLRLTIPDKPKSKNQRYYSEDISVL